MNELQKTTPNSDIVNKTFDEAIVLLGADQDFTEADKKSIATSYRKTISDAKALNSLGQSGAVATAINNSSVKPKVVDSALNSVTPTSGSAITYFPDISYGSGVTTVTTGATYPIAVDPAKVKMTIDPKKLDSEFQRIKASVGQASEN